MAESGPLLNNIADLINFKGEAVLILGDSNGQIPVHGPLIPDIGEQKNCKKTNGKKLVEFAASHELRILNRDVMCDEIWTWSRKDKRTVLDYVLANEIMYSLAAKVTIHDDDEVTTGSDHNPVTVELNLCVASKPKVPKCQTGWKLTDSGLKKISNMVEQQIFLSNDVAQNLNYDDFEHLSSALACKTPGIPKTFATNNIRVQKEVSRTVRSAMHNVRVSSRILRLAIKTRATKSFITEKWQMFSLQNRRL